MQWLPGMWMICSTFDRPSSALTPDQVFVLKKSDFFPCAFRGEKSILTIGISTPLSQFWGE
jgi:hypothetical protein